MLSESSRCSFPHKRKVEDHKSDIANTAILSVGLQIQGHALFCVTLNLTLRNVLISE